MAASAVVRRQGELRLHFGQPGKCDLELHGQGADDRRDVAVCQRLFARSTAGCRRSRWPATTSSSTSTTAGLEGRVGGAADHRPMRRTTARDSTSVWAGPQAGPALYRGRCRRLRPRRRSAATLAGARRRSFWNACAHQAPSWYWTGSSRCVLPPAPSRPDCPVRADALDAAMRRVRGAAAQRLSGPWPLVRRVHPLQDGPCVTRAAGAAELSFAATTPGEP